VKASRLLAAQRGRGCAAVETAWNKRKTTNASRRQPPPCTPGLQAVLGAARGCARAGFRDRRRLGGRGLRGPVQYASSRPTTLLRRCFGSALVVVVVQQRGRRDATLACGSR
jgi:hypothetical protein